MILLRRNQKRIKFTPALLSEKSDALVNPQRGWYRIFYFVLRKPVNIAEIEKELDPSQTLVMAFIDISEIGNGSFTEEDNAQITEILTFFNEIGKDVILRFAYDRSGRAMETEPGSFSAVLNHAKSIKDAVNLNKDKVFILQGLIVGNWGEMHSSKYVFPEKLSEIGKIFEQTDKSIFLAVRKPLQWRELYSSYSKKQSLESIRTGIFNDGMLGSDTDLGTYGYKSKNEVGFRCEWNANEETEFIGIISEKNPIGGEAVNNDEGDYDWEYVVNRLKRSGVTYLNSEHDKEVLDKWKNRYNGGALKEKISLYDYVGNHLGYRFAVKNVKAKTDKKGETILCIKISNDGFAPAYFDTTLKIELSNADEKREISLSSALNGILSGEEKEIRAEISEFKGDVFLKAERTSDKRTVFLANECDENGRVYLGRMEQK